MWHLDAVENLPDDLEQTWACDYESLKHLLEAIASVINTEPAATSFVFTIVPPRS